MNYNEFMKIISSSNVDDWTYDDDCGRYVYLNDINFSMQRIPENENCEFREDWATIFSDPKATKLMVNLCYMGNPITVFYTAAVDGARINIPYPRTKDMTISQEQYNIGRIINHDECAVIDNYDEYLTRAGIKVR